MADDARYAYAVGRIRALEIRLLDKSRFESMVSARDAEEALRTLSDTDYGPFLPEPKRGRDFEVALNGELKSVLGLVSLLSQDAELTDIFRLRYDFHNLKVFLKLKYLQAEEGYRPLTRPARRHFGGGYGLMDAGLIEPTKLKKIVEEDNYKELPRELRLAAERAIKTFQETHDAQRIALILDGEMSALFYQKTRPNDYSFLRGYFRTDFDLTNIKNFLRVKELRLGKGFFEEIFLEGGSLEKSLFLESSEEPVNNFVSLLSPTPYGALVAEGIKYRQENRSWSELERLADNYLLSYLRRAKYIVFGLEPLIAYLLARENEIKMIRIIMVGKLNGMPEDLIRGRLRETY